MSKKKNTFTNANSTPISVTKPQTTTHNTNNKWWLYGSYVALFLLVFMLYKVGFGNDFVDWDDITYIKENLYILNPSWSNAWLFLKSSYFGNYHPLTMWSYMANVALFGKDASSIIITNVLLHALNSCMVLYLAYRLAGRSLWVGVLTALFFAIHPLHVESVTWVSERKDVLYGGFFIGACISYWTYLTAKKQIWYALTLVLFLLSCLSKPAAVVLPLVLLLLDNWHKRPLTQTKVWIEKIPFFAFSLLFGLIAANIQSGGNFYGALPSLSEKAFAISSIDFSLWQRIQIASYGFVVYMFKLFVPYGMAAYHPYPSVFTNAVFIICPIIVFLLLAATLYTRKYTNTLFWSVAFYTLTIALVLQFVSVGSAIIAERYTYIPYIGLLFGVFYGLNGLVLRKPLLKMPITIAAAVVSLAFATSSYQYIQTWKNSITLWDNVINLYPDVAKPYALRGTFKGKSGDLAGSLKDFEHALALDTTYAPTYEGLGNIYGAQGQAPKALQMFEKAIKLDPKNGKSYYNRAMANVQLNRLELVLPDLDQALALAPNSTPDIQSLRGFVQIQQKQYDAAIASYNQVIQLRPDANAYYYQGIAYLNNNQSEKARANFLKALQLNPKLSEAQQYLDKMGN